MKCISKTVVLHNPEFAECCFSVPEFFSFWMLTAAFKCLLIYSLS